MRKRSGSLLGAVLLALGLGLMGYTIYSWVAEPTDTPVVDVRPAATDAMYADTAPWNQSTPLNQAGTLGDRSYAALPGASLAVTEAAPVTASNSTTSTTTPSATHSTTSTPSPAGNNITPLPGATVSSYNPAVTNSLSDPTGLTTPLSGTAETTPSTTQPTVPLIDSPGSSLPSSIHVDATQPSMTTFPTTIAPATHKIEAGDTLGSIAKKYLGKESRWTEIAKLNPGMDPHRLKIGDVVKLPEASTRTTSATTPSTDTTTPGDPPSEIVVPMGGKTHTVREGDTFWIIAEEHYGSGALWQTIYRANKPIVGANPDKLTTGMKLIVPPKPQQP